MPKRPKGQILSANFNWKLFTRDGVIYADGRLNQPSVGKHSLGTRDHEEALVSLRELDRRMAGSHSDAKPPASIGQAPIPIADGWERYAQHVARPGGLGGAGFSTQKRYKAVRQKHEGFCEKQNVASWNYVDKAHVTAYGTFLKKLDYSDATLYLECTLLKQVVKFFIDEEKSLPESQRIRLALRRSEESSTYCYSREQVTEIRKLCRAKPKLRWLDTVVAGLVMTGMRIGELAGLRWSDVDLTADVITVPDTRHSGRHSSADAVRRNKGRRTRRMPIHASLHAILDGLPRHSDGRVFRGHSGGTLQANSLCKIFIREVIGPLKAKFLSPPGEIGFADGRIHSFRHVFVSQAFLHGVGEGEIREWVGHRDSRIVERYRHLGDDDAKRKMSRIQFLDEALTGSATTNTDTAGEKDTKQGR